MATVMTRNGYITAGLSVVPIRIILMTIVLTANPIVMAFITRTEVSRYPQPLFLSNRNPDKKANGTTRPRSIAWITMVVVFSRIGFVFCRIGDRILPVQARIRNRQIKKKKMANALRGSFGEKCPARYEMSKDIKQSIKLNKLELKTTTYKRNNWLNEVNIDMDMYVYRKKPNVPVSNSRPRSEPRKA